MERRNWTREELLVALRLYCELDFGQFHASNNRVIEVADLLGRTPGSIAMKLGNLASLDPAMHGKGLSSVSKADIKIMEKFLHDTERVVLEAEEATHRLLSAGQYTGFAEEAVAFEHEHIAETERLSPPVTDTSSSPAPV